MISRIPIAEYYWFIPMEDLGTVEINEEEAVYVGGKGILNEVAFHMNDDMVLGYTGVEGVRCLIMTTMTRKEAQERVEIAKINYDRRLEGTL